jgi:HD-like signal output (HDOD) protein/ActR/RegA family two-component response regulator
MTRMEARRLDRPKRILFVDDEHLVLKVLERIMLDLRPEWEAEFVDSAYKGLERFNVAPYDVVVADLRMPGMNGAEFLQEIMARYPATVRLVLSDFGDQEVAAKCLGLAHQFLVKPCVPEFFKSVIQFATSLGSRVGNDHVRELVSRIGQLPAVPDTYRKLVEALESEHSANEQLGEIIGQDLAMTAMVLKLANSAFFSVRQGIASPAEAISYLGIDLIKSLVLAHGLFGQVGAFRIPTFNIQHLWAHSLSVAGATRRIAESQGISGREASTYFTAGLLHDVGILILASRFPEDYVKVLDTTRRAGGDLEAAEHHIFGATHGEVGAYLLGLWGLPAPVILAAAYHHLPRQQPTPGFSTALAVHVADALHSMRAEHPLFSAARIDSAYLATLGLTGRLEAWREAAPEPAQSVF